MIIRRIILILLIFLLSAKVLLAGDVKLRSGLVISDEKLKKIEESLPKLAEDKVFYHWTTTENAIRWSLQGYLDEGEVKFLSTPSGNKQVYGPGVYWAESTTSSKDFGEYLVSFRVPQGTLIYDESVVTQVIGKIDNNTRSALGEVIPYIVNLKTSDWWLTTHSKNTQNVQFESASLQTKKILNVGKILAIIDKLKEQFPDKIGSLGYFESLLTLTFYSDGISFQRAINVSPHNPWSQFEPEKFENFKETLIRTVLDRQEEKTNSRIFRYDNFENFLDSMLRINRAIGGNGEIRGERIRVTGNDAGNKLAVTPLQLKALLDNPYIWVDYEINANKTGFLVTYNYPDCRNYKKFKGVLSEELYNELEGYSIDYLKNDGEISKQLNKKIVLDLLKTLYEKNQRTVGDIRVLMNLIAIHPFNDLNGRTTRLMWAYINNQFHQFYLSDFDLLTSPEIFQRIFYKDQEIYSRLVGEMFVELIHALKEGKMPEYFDLPSFKNLDESLSIFGIKKLNFDDDRVLEMIRLRKFYDLFGQNGGYLWDVTNEKEFGEALKMAQKNNLTGYMDAIKDHFKLYYFKSKADPQRVKFLFDVMKYLKEIPDYPELSEDVEDYLVNAYLKNNMALEDYQALEEIFKTYIKNDPSMKGFQQRMIVALKKDLKKLEEKKFPLDDLKAPFILDILESVGEIKESYFLKIHYLTKGTPLKNGGYHIKSLYFFLKKHSAYIEIADAMKDYLKDKISNYQLKDIIEEASDIKNYPSWMVKRMMKVIEKAQHEPGFYEILFTLKAVNKFEMLEEMIEKGYDKELLDSLHLERKLRLVRDIADKTISTYVEMLNAGRISKQKFLGGFETIIKYSTFISDNSITDFCYKLLDKKYLSRINMNYASDVFRDIEGMLKKDILQRVNQPNRSDVDLLIRLYTYQHLLGNAKTTFGLDIIPPNMLREVLNQVNDKELYMIMRFVLYQTIMVFNSTGKHFDEMIERLLKVTQIDPSGMSELIRQLSDNLFRYSDAFAGKVAAESLIRFKKLLNKFKVFPPDFGRLFIKGDKFSEIEKNKFLNYRMKEARQVAKTQNPSKEQIQDVLNLYTYLRDNASQNDVLENCIISIVDKGGDSSKIIHQFIPVSLNRKLLEKMLKQKKRKGYENLIKFVALKYVEHIEQSFGHDLTSLENDISWFLKEVYPLQKTASPRIINLLGNVMEKKDRIYNQKTQQLLEETAKKEVLKIISSETVDEQFLTPPFIKLLNTIKYDTNEMKLVEDFIDKLDTNKKYFLSFEEVLRGAHLKDKVLMLLAVRGIDPKARGITTGFSEKSMANVYVWALQDNLDFSIIKDHLIQLLSRLDDNSKRHMLAGIRTRIGDQLRYSSPKYKDSFLKLLTLLETRKSDQNCHDLIMNFI